MYEFPRTVQLSFNKVGPLRYGENSHQEAVIFQQVGYEGPTLLDAVLLSGKELSFNNYRDLEACLDMLLDFERPFACLLKHRNPCGAAIADTLAAAYEAAYATDRLSAFGCIIGLNREVDLDCAKLVHETGFVECVLAPGYTDEALALLKKKKNRRILALPTISVPQSTTQSILIRGGMLMQTLDDQRADASMLKLVTEKSLTEKQIESLLFAEMVCKHTISNAIVFVKGTATVGIGGGNTSRVDSAWMAIKRTGDRAKGACVASDAFFPMPDGVEACTNAGAVAFIQPGGSKNDQAAIDAVNKAGAAMVFTGVRHFKH